MRGFGITGIDFSIEVQMDKLAHAIAMDPMEFRIINAYRDGDMKAHRRVAHNTALVECVQVAAEKAGWPLSETAQRASSLHGGGGDRAVIPPTVTDTLGQLGNAAARPARPIAAPVPPRAPEVRRPLVEPLRAPAEPPRWVALPPPPPRPPAPPSLDTRRFSPTLGTRRR